MDNTMTERAPILALILILSLTLAAATSALAQAAPPTDMPVDRHSDPGWSQLEQVDSALVELARPVDEHGLPDWSAQTIAARAEAIKGKRQQLEAIDPAQWSVDGKVDYLLVRARLHGLEFEHRVLRPWARDPIFWLGQAQSAPYVELPLTGEEAGLWRAKLSAIPALYERAQGFLTEASGELAELAVFHLEHFDGVGQGQPYRDQPPEGMIGWFADLCRRVGKNQAEDLAACQRAEAAVIGYRNWLRANRSKMLPSAGIGIDELSRYLHDVRLLPYNVEEVVILGEREFHRYRATWEIVRNRNRNLPELELTRSREQHEQRTREGERQIRELVAEQDLLTIPDDVPENFETDVFWSPRALDDRHFWEELQFRNTLNNHIHASIPGHRFDGMMSQRVENPIRRRYGDSTRAEGWATYLEEMLVLAGITDDRPRAAELFYVALMKRASRIYAETMMHAGRFSLDDANRYMIDYVPFMEEDLGRYDLEGYLRRPGQGSGYILGKIQLEQLLAERSLQLGGDFNLGAFHDELLSQGMIPLTLLRWEMTGYDDQVREYWGQIVGLE
jgi:hypothetical protein